MPTGPGLQRNRAALLVAELDELHSWQDGRPSTLSMLDALACAGLALISDEAGVVVQAFVAEAEETHSIRVGPGE